MGTKTRTVVVDVGRDYQFNIGQRFAVVVPEAMSDAEVLRAVETADISDCVDWYECFRDHDHGDHDGESFSLDADANPSLYDWLRLDGGKLEKSSPPDLPGEPPESAWFTIDGVEWATTGAILVRRDGPRPTSIPANWAGWRTPSPDGGASMVRPESVRDLLNSIKGAMLVHRGVFDIRYRPMLMAGSAYAPSTDELAPAAVWSGGSIVAVVMPCRLDTRGDEVLVDSSGKKVKR